MIFLSDDEVRDIESDLGLIRANARGCLNGAASKENIRAVMAIADLVSARLMGREEPTFEDFIRALQERIPTSSRLHIEFTLERNPSVMMDAVRSRLEKITTLTDESRAILSMPSNV
jgi:hypothetical protein